MSERGATEPARDGDCVTLSSIGLLRTLQLACPSLPIGAYAYSQGMEKAVELEWVRNEDSARDWILGLLRYAVAGLDIPILARAYSAWRQRDLSGVRHWSLWLLAARESAELQAEERHLGRALARVLAAHGVTDAERYVDAQEASYVTLFALGATSFGLDLRTAATAYSFAWAEHQVSASARLIPLGQLASQRLLSSALEAATRAIDHGLDLEDHQIGFLAPGQAMASAWHERQYSRLFRS